MAAVTLGKVLVMGGHWLLSGIAGLILLLLLLLLCWHKVSLGSVTVRVVLLLLL